MAMLHIPFIGLSRWLVYIFISRRGTTIDYFETKFERRDYLGERSTNSSNWQKILADFQRESLNI